MITLHSKIKVRRTGVDKDGNPISQVVDCTLGRILFNEIILQDLGFVDRSKPENALAYEIDFHVGKKQLKQILDKCINIHGATKTAEVLDDIKAIGYKFSTRGALTVSISDMTVPPEKPQILGDAQKQVEFITEQYKRGLMTEEERYKAVVKTWFDADDVLTDKLITGLDRLNNIFMMADSGARGSNQQIKQLAGMRGLMADTSGRTIELPIKSNFREGLDVLEYFISAHGARKGLSDTALRTADSGYLTRRLVDVSQDLIIREQDCCEGTGEEIPGMYVEAFMDGQEVIESLEERITGRYAAEELVNKETGEVIVKANHMITPKRAKAVCDAGYTSVKIRTMLTCKSGVGACAKCYGSNMATGQAVQVGEAVGIIAAQSIGEPGTQLTMRTFHAGGVAGDDITQGLPRVEELFEARRPKGQAVITEVDGRVSIGENKGRTEVTVITDDGEAHVYVIPFAAHLAVMDGQRVEAGQELTEGSINPQDLLLIKGPLGVQEYLLREVQKVYRLQGVDINDKHIEVMVRQMMRKVKVEEVGDSKFLAGSQVEIIDFDEENERLEAEGLRPAVGEIQLLGITKAALATDSFLSAASFQETTKVLTDSAIKGKSDHLIGLKENVILGKLIPAGTGMRHYRRIELEGEAYESAYDQVTDSTAGENAEGEDGIAIQEAPADHQEKKERRPVFI